MKFMSYDKLVCCTRYVYATRKLNANNNTFNTTLFPVSGFYFILFRTDKRLSKNININIEYSMFKLRDTYKLTDSLFSNMTEWLLNINSNTSHIL